MARSFVDAVIWGEHSTVWNLLSAAGRDRVLLAGGRGGLDAVRAERLRQGTSPAAEVDEFLSGLVRGLRVDLSSAELEDIEVSADVEDLGDMCVRIKLEAPAPFSSERWLVATVDLSRHDDRWLIDSLAPRRIKK